MKASSVPDDAVVYKSAGALAAAELKVAKVIRLTPSGKRSGMLDQHTTVLGRRY